MVEEYPKLKEYLLDSDGNLRHLSLFLNGEMVISTEALDLVIDDKSELFVMRQSLVGELLLVL